MSTRVQKGSAVFKPVAKPRARPSNTLSKPFGAPNESHTAVATGSMPPPLVIPTRALIPDENSGNLSGIPNHYPFSMNPATSSVNTSPPPIVSPDCAPEIAISHSAAMGYPGPGDFFHQNGSSHKGEEGIELYRGAIMSSGSDLSLPAAVSVDVSDTSKKKRNSASKNSEHSGDGPLSQKQMRGGSQKPRKSRASSVRPFDANADPGEIIDPTVVTMAALCNDTGQGRVSSKAVEIRNNHIAWRATSRDKRARMKSLMEAKKFRKLENDDEVRSSTPNKTSDKCAIPGPSSIPAEGSAPIGSNDGQGSSKTDDRSGHGFDYTQDLAVSRFNVQVRIGPNGETFIDEESLFVDRNDEENTEHYTQVEESDNTKFVNSGTYGKKFRGSRWGAEETELFYHALSQFGENYELISYVLPGRDRKSCKNKFKTEDRKNPNRITYCLNNRIPYDIENLARMTGKDFSGPTPEIHPPTPLTLAEPEDSNNLK